MILTVTLNPAVDKTLETKRLMTGQVNRVRSAVSIPGGKGINVTRILRQLKEPVTALGFLGGSGGRMIEEALRALSVECRFTGIEAETRISTNIVAADGCVTEVLEPGPVVGDRELFSFLREYEDSLPFCELVVLSGSLPGGVPADIYKTLTRLAGKAGKRVLLDSSGEALRSGLQASPYLIKPNRKELEDLAGRSLGDKEKLEREAGELLAAGIEVVVVSLGAEGLLWVDKERTLAIRAPRIEAVNTVSCGDSVVASLSKSLLHGEAPIECLKKAAALSAANATTRMSGNVPLDTYERLLCETKFIVC